MLKLRSIGMTVAGVMAVGMASGSTAAVAAPPSASHRVPIDNSFLDGLVVSGTCAFDVQFGVVTSRAYQVHTTTASDGTVTFRATGSLVVTATNLSNNRSVTLNAGGPSTVVVAPDGSVAVTGEGHTLNIFTPPAPAGSPIGIFVTTGKVDVALDPAGNVTRFVPAGTVTDVCSLLT